MPMPCPCQQQMMRPDFAPRHFDRADRGEFHKKFEKKHADRPLPPSADRPEVDD